MDTFLLAPNAPAQKPIQTQDRQNTSESSKEGFAPLLNESINKQEGSETPNKEVASADTEQVVAPTDTEQVEEAPSNPSQLTTESPEDSQITGTDETDISDNTISQVSQLPQLFQVSQDSEIPIFIKLEQSQQTPIVVNPESTPEISVLAKAEQVNISKQDSAQLPVFTIPPAQGETQAALQASAPLIQSGPEENINPSSKSETLLLQQIQQLLNEGKNKGPIVITNTTQQVTAAQAQIDELQKLSSPALLSTKNGVIQAQQTVPALEIEEVKGIEPNKSVKLEGNRQDITGQYISAKMGDANSKENTSGGQSQQSGSEQHTAGEQNKNVTQPAPGVVSFSLSSTNTEESIPGLHSNLTPTTPGQVSVEGKFAPGAQVTIPEHEIVNHLVQRFNVNPRLQTSKLTMQLHPAELGALKVDILVKEGSIKANIVAQSQQVLETLEKNMPRLRAALEDQGFSIDSFEITMDNDGGRQQELFHENFTSQEQEFSFTKSSAKETESFGLVLDNIDESVSSSTDNTGINVTA